MKDGHHTFRSMKVVRFLDRSDGADASPDPYIQRSANRTAGCLRFALAGRVHNGACPDV